jgi:TolA-binding protein
VAEFPASPQAPAATLALGWTEFRRGRLDPARQRWARFAQERASDPRAPAALLLAAELSANAGDVAGARAHLDRLVSRYPQDELASLAALNRSILAVRAGRSADALRELSRLPPGTAYAGRVRVARGVALMDTGRQGEARSEFEAAVNEGEDLARLGLARIALERRQWPEATRELLAVRDAGGGATAAAAEYGLAAVLYNQGKKQDFARLAGPLLAGPADPATTPYLLAGMADVAAEDKKWPEARALTQRLVSQFQATTAAPAALAALGAAASRDGQWAISREAHQALIDRYPTSPAVELGQVDFAEALLRTGAAPEARRRLESFVTGFPDDPRAPRAMLLLAEAREATGDRAAALEIYARLGQNPATRGADTALLAQGRLLQAEGKWDQARPLLERALDIADPAVNAEAAYRLGEGFRGASQHQDAIELYMTAAYLAPDSQWGRRALLAAGQSFTALKQKDAAEIVYRKLVAAKDVEAELADAARKELRALGAQ